MPGTAWNLLKHSVLEFIDDDALSRGAAIAFYAVTSLVPVLLIVIAIAGLAFGEAAATNAIQTQLTGLMGTQSAEMLQNAVKNVSDRSSGIIATIVGIVMLVLTASGMFGEMQATLNAIWKAQPRGTTVSRLIRARAASLGLVGALGFLLIVSLAISAGLAAFADVLNAYLPFAALILTVVNTALSLLLLSLLFAAIYKVLPDTPLEWRDVAVGAVATAVLFTVGKSLIGWYIGSSGVASAYGAASALLVVLLWVYYSAQIFLFGAEFTKVFARRHGSQRDPAAEIPDATEPGAPRPAASPGWTPLSAALVTLALLVSIRRNRLKPIRA